MGVFPRHWKVKNMRVLSPEYPDWTAVPEYNYDGTVVTAPVPPFRHWVPRTAGKPVQAKRAPDEKPYP